MNCYQIKQFKEPENKINSNIWVDPDDWLHKLGTMERRLIIDDLGAGYIDRGWTHKRFERLIDLRYRNNRPTAITTNLAVKALEQELGERIISRITDANIGAVIILNNAKDVRGKKR